MLRQLLQQYRVIQAPMAGVQGAELAIAVSEAGGIGSLPAAMLSTDALRASLEQIQAGTSQPYNVNFFCHQEPEPDAVAQQRWHDTLAAYYNELDADANAPAGPARAPFSQESLAVLANFKAPIVSFHFGLPSAELLAGVKAWGAYVLGSATTVAEAQWLQAHGADGVIAQGIEAGGHQGRFLAVDQPTETYCLALTRAIAAAVELPVVAAGGIATRAHARAAVQAGAVAVQAGSAYLQAHEAKTSTVHRAALQSDAARHTVLTNVFSGRRARGIVNRIIREQGPISDLVPAFPTAAAAMAPLRAAAEAQGSGDFTSLWSGENGYLSQAQSAAEITHALRPDDSTQAAD